MSALKRHVITMGSVSANHLGYEPNRTDSEDRNFSECVVMTEWDDSGRSSRFKTKKLLLYHRLVLKFQSLVDVA